MTAALVVGVLATSAACRPADVSTDRVAPVDDAEANAENNTDTDAYSMFGSAPPTVPDPLHVGWALTRDGPLREARNEYLSEDLPSCTVAYHERVILDGVTIDADYSVTIAAADGDGNVAVTITPSAAEPSAAAYPPLVPIAIDGFVMNEWRTTFVDFNKDAALSRIGDTYAVSPATLDATSDETVSSIATVNADRTFVTWFSVGQDIASGFEPVGRRSTSITDSEEITIEVLGMYPDGAHHIRKTVNIIGVDEIEEVSMRVVRSALAFTDDARGERIAVNFESGAFHKVYEVIYDPLNGRPIKTYRRSEVTVEAAGDAGFHQLEERFGTFDWTPDTC